MIRKSFFIFLFLLVITSLKANEQINKLAAPILAALDEGKIDELVTLAFPKDSNSNGYLSKADVEYKNQEFKSNIQAYGKFHGSKLIHESELKDVYALRYYLLKFKRQPVLLQLEFYKPDDVWHVQGIQTDADLDVYMKDASKFSIGNMGIKN